MDPRYSGREYDYPELAKQHWASPSALPAEGNNNDSQAEAQTDILQNFPYLRQGFVPRFPLQPQHSATVSSTALNLNTSIALKNSYTPQRFEQTTNIDPYANSGSMQHFMDSVRPLAGRLPSVSTFNTSLSHMQQQMSNPVATPAFSSADDILSPKTYSQSDMHGLTTVSGLGEQTSCSMTNPSSLNLNSNELASSSGQSLPSIYHVINKELQTEREGKPSSRVLKGSENFGAISTMAEVAPVSFISDSVLYDSSQKRNAENTAVSNASATSHYNPMIPVTGENGVNSSQYSGKSSFSTEPAEGAVKEEKSISRVKFLLKGHLSPKAGTTIKSPREILKEPVDLEETFYDNVVFNFSSKPSGNSGQNAALNEKNLLNRSYDFKPSYKKTAMKLYETKMLQKKATDTEELPAYTEPSIAKLRQDAMKIEEGAFGKFPADFDPADSSGGGTATEPQSSSGTENKNSEFEVIDGDLNFNWYSAAMKKYASVDNNNLPNPVEPSPIKRGGRSDPDNPFAITSPSFSESAARAVITTTNSSTGTIVSISIMSIGSRKKLIPNITNSEAARGGLVSISNPIVIPEDSTTTADSEEGGVEVKLETTSIMSKLNREKKEKEEAEEESKDTSIDHLDVSVHIDDKQCIDHGDQKRWQCKLCPKLYTTKHNLVAHILDHSGIKPHLCLVCGKYFKQLSHLNTHMLTHDMVKPHKCTVCNKGFTQVSHLKRHQAVHMETKPQAYTCPTCNRGFAFPSELKAHQERHLLNAEMKLKCGDDDGDDGLKCCYCKRMFSFPSQLRDHMMTHAGARPYICTECGMDFMKDHHLKAHLFTHTGLRPYSCPHCSRSFNQKANMVRHMLIHNSERAFKCEVCSKTFTQPQTLKAHMVVHADKKPYSCKYCGKQFGRLHNLQGHLHIHSDSKPYICSICQSTFTLKGNLNRHKKVKHGLNESTENMEEDAVNFLSSLSDRVRDGSIDPDQDSRDDGMSSEMSSPSLKKGRKSVPRKRVSQQQLFVDQEAEDGGGGGSDWEASSDTETDDKTVGASYSDEERENEERLGKEVVSKYFTEADDEGKSRRKRKQNVCYRFEGEGDDGNLGDTVEGGDGNMKEEDGESNDTIDLDYSIVKTEINPSDDEADVEPVEEKRPVRKRRRKQLEDGFVDDDEEEEEFSNGSEETAAKSRRKGDILDTIIATKFSNA